jgi:hypothetical protein
MSNTCTFRNTWAVLGPADTMKPGTTVTVEKKNGTTIDVEIDVVSEPFECNGKTCRYGYSASGGSPRRKKVAEPKRRSRRGASKPSKGEQEMQAQLAALQAQLAELSGAHAAE